MSAAEPQVMGNQRVKEDLTGLLQELNGLGFSWRAIAHVAHAPVPILRKWRTGFPATSEHHRRVAQMAAICQFICDKYQIEDVAGWLETPLHPEAPTTGLDLLAGDRSDLVLRLARDRGESPEKVLDEFEPGWRECYVSSIKMFTASDGLPGLHLVE